MTCLIDRRVFLANYSNILAGSVFYRPVDGHPDKVMVMQIKPDRVVSNFLNKTKITL